MVGVSGIVGGAPLAGMADKLLPVAGAEVSAAGVAEYYGDLLAAFRHHCRALTRLAAPFNQHRPKEEAFRPKWESSGH